MERLRFFEDDTIETIRTAIGIVQNTHPDGLYILIQIERPADYYSKNPHKWEALFNRLAMNEKVISRTAFTEYQTFYRNPPTHIPYSEWDRSTWISVPSDLKPIHSPAETIGGADPKGQSFYEYLIFGVAEEISYILPRSFEKVGNIPADSYPIPELSSLLSSLYDPHTIRGWHIIEYAEETPTQLLYFPFMRGEDTPAQVPPEEVRLWEANHTKLEKLLALRAPVPEAVSIVRTRFQIPWIGTDFGAGIRTRFEQMFYGLSVSESIPCITLFTSTNEVSRHKFYTHTPEKTPALNLAMWTSWWSNTKPSRNRPTLVLYRGKSTSHFDRVAITAVDMVVSTYRPEGNTDTLEDLQQGARDWISTFDAIVSFVDSGDLESDRWDLQDLSFAATYDSLLEQYDLRRLPCVSRIFDIADPATSTFRFLRTDSSVHGLSITDIVVLQKIREDPELTSSKLAGELGVSAEKAREILTLVKNKVDNEPGLLEKSFRGFPTMRFGQSNVVCTSTHKLDLTLRYANILRYILSNPDSPEIDAVCPKRMEVVESREIPVEEEIVVDDDFADFGDDIEVAEKVPTNVQEPEAETEQIQIKSTRKTMYNYFNTRLRAFNADVYSDSQYPKKCEQKHQPIILTDAELEILQGTPYDPRSYMKENERIGVAGGLIICPEYWCIYDKIPLRANQLQDNTCPQCHRKVKEKVEQDPNEYSVIHRDSAFKYPGYTGYQSPITKEFLPCCYKTPETKAKQPTEDKYYILGDTKTAVPPLRLSFIPTSIQTGLEIAENKIEGARLQPANSGFFRVGIGRPSATFPTLLGLKTTIPAPLDAVNIVLHCSFFATWTALVENADLEEELESEPLARRVAGIHHAYMEKTLSFDQELEYVARVLQCEIFQVQNTAIECTFSVRNASRAIVVLGNTALAHVARTANTLTYTANLHSKFFTDTTRDKLKSLRTMACTSSVPRLEDALHVAGTTEVQYILDPYTRAQALYIPSKLLLPFQAESVSDVPTLGGYELITELPTYDTARAYLKKAVKVSSGYAWAGDLVNSAGERSGIRLACGLHIPVKPEKMEASATDVIESVNTIGERKMTFGEPNADIQQTYREISYASELFEFILFELSNTLDEYPALREALKNPTRKTIEAPLRHWFSEQTTEGMNAKNFIRKVRQPCGQFTNKTTCESGNVCGWNGTCKVAVSEKGNVFHRVLTTMVENGKLRAMVLDGRVSPFFSTILYLELPNEVILSDVDIVR